MKQLIARTAAIVAVALLPATAQAQATADDTMEVSATVSRSCTVTADALAFGTVLEGAATTAGVSVSCTAGSDSDAPTITVSDGANRATDGLRQMIGGDSLTAFVPYTISATLGGADLAAADTVALTVVGDGTSYSTTLHGSIEASGDYQIGTYADTVTVTVTYAN